MEATEGPWSEGLLQRIGGIYVGSDNLERIHPLWGNGRASEAAFRGPGSEDTVSPPAQ
jgi:hypothetical protein